MPGYGDLEYLLGSWAGSVLAQVLAVAFCCGAGVWASLRIPEGFMHPSPLSLEQRNLSFIGLAGSEVHGGAVSG